MSADWNNPKTKAVIDQMIADGLLPEPMDPVKANERRWSEQGSPELWARVDALAAEVETNRKTIAGLEARVEALTGALTALEKQASITANRGAVTGPHWTHLTIACLKARSAILGGTPDATHR